MCHMIRHSMGIYAQMNFSVMKIKLLFHSAESGVRSWQHKVINPKQSNPWDEGAKVTLPKHLKNFITLFNDRVYTDSGR